MANNPAICISINNKGTFHDVSIIDYSERDIENTLLTFSNQFLRYEDAVVFSVSKKVQKILQILQKN